MPLADGVSFPFCFGSSRRRLVEADDKGTRAFPKDVHSDDEDSFATSLGESWSARSSFASTCGSDELESAFNVAERSCRIFAFDEEASDFVASEEPDAGCAPQSESLADLFFFDD